MEHTKGESKIEGDFGQTEETPCCYIKINGIVYFQTLCGNDRVNAERLVLCWNSHDALLAACKGLMEEADNGSARFDDPEPDSIFIKANAIITEIEKQ